MNKRLLAGMIAVMTLSGVSASAIDSNESKAEGNRDSRIIVEVNEGLGNLSQDEIFKSQDKVLTQIKNQVSKNVELVQRYSVLNNAFVLEVSSEDISAIKELGCVKSVTVDKIHAKESLDDGSYYSVTINRPIKHSDDETGDMVTNISAETMNKPSGTNDGEGTVIAILDNEFYLKGNTDPDGDNHWNHVVYKDLDSSVAKKFTFENISELLTDGRVKFTYAQRQEGANPGDEGSLYFNSKVPFYYDYGGESTSYGKVGPMDYDVSSTLTYHGSHVASIASANADKYKGIAPKAQLACMKVFTTYIADQTGEQMGFGTSTGAYDSAILSAIEDAIALGVDGINMSLGSDLDDFDQDSITMKTLRSLADDSGIMSAISAGNAGKSSYSFTGGYGNWTTDMVETGILGSYANSTSNTIIASGQPTKIYFENAIQILGEDGVTGVKNVAFEDQIINREGADAEFADNNQRWMIKDIVGDNLETKVEWQYVTGFGEATDYTDLDVKGKVAVVNRGSTSFADKYNVAVDKGAIGLIIVNNDPTATDFNFRCSFGDDFSPSRWIPCALALYKDKPTFETYNHGEFKFIQKNTSTNDAARTISSYSSDGARFDYTLKPDITTPGENIRGAVPPQKKEHREESPYSTYEYLSGTSMAAPNYAGAQSLVLSKFAKGVYADGIATTQELEDLEAFRRSVDMRLMSTANPMLDASKNPETNVINYTSPRMQGAGMVDLDKAYNTDIYLEGIDANGLGIGKSKIELKNNEDIAKGNIKLSFLAYNDSSSAQTYTPKVTVMRPAIVNSNKVVSKEYNLKGEFDDITKIPGLTYVAEEYNTTTHQTEPVLKTNPLNGASKNDVIKVTKQIKYFETIADFNAKTNEKVFNQDFYVNTATSGVNWSVLPGYDYQSVQDVVIDTFTVSDVTIPANAKGVKITLDSHSLTEQVKNDIMSKYPYGCALEGFVELQQNEETKLSMPYLGFFSGDELSLRDAPVAEPFDFEKDPSAIYSSDLVNDVTKQLVGKDQVDFSSSWTVGYAESTLDVNTDKVLTNDTNFANMQGFYKIGMNPANGKYFNDVNNNLYVGNPEKTNTMIIHQFMMRSVKDNFFTIKNEKGEQVYKSVLEDMLFGGTALYKSHVDSNYLSAGYVAHRAYAIIPLYDSISHKAFADGKYTIEFNYQLSYDSSWVKKSYNFIIDSTAPEFTDVEEYVNDAGEARVRINISDTKIVSGKLGYRTVGIKYDSTAKTYYIDESKETILDTMEQIGATESGQKRLFVKVIDAAYGEKSAIIHFFGGNCSNYVMAQGTKLTVDLDFVKDGTNVTWMSIDYLGEETEYELKDFVTIKTSFIIEPELPKDDDNDNEKKGCGGSIIAASALISTAALVGASLLASKKRKEEEDK